MKLKIYRKRRKGDYYFGIIFIVFGGYAIYHTIKLGFSLSNIIIGSLFIVMGLYLFKTNNSLKIIECERYEVLEEQQEQDYSGETVYKGDNIDKLEEEPEVKELRKELKKNDK